MLLLSNFHYINGSEQKIHQRCHGMNTKNRNWDRKRGRETVKIRMHFLYAISDSNATKFAFWPYCKWRFEQIFSVTHRTRNSCGSSGCSINCDYCIDCVCWPLAHIYRYHCKCSALCVLICTFFFILVRSPLPYSLQLVPFMLLCKRSMFGT